MRVIGGGFGREARERAKRRPRLPTPRMWMRRFSRSGSLDSTGGEACVPGKLATVQEQSLVGGELSSRMACSHFGLADGLALVLIILRTAGSPSGRVLDQPPCLCRANLETNIKANFENGKVLNVMFEPSI